MSLFISTQRPAHATVKMANTTNSFSAYDTSADNTSAYHNSAYNTSAYNTSAFNTSAHDTSGSYTSFYRLITVTVLSMHYGLLVLCIVAFIYGVTSWRAIKEFRHFRNYVLLNVIFTNMMRFLFSAISMSFVLAICLSSFQFWLLVLSCIYYSDFVNIFKSDIRRKYLKTGLFAWGGPLILWTIPFIYVIIYGVLNHNMVLGENHFFSSTYYVIIVFCIPAAVNLFIYIAVLYILIRGSDGTTTSTNKWRSFFIALLIFIQSNSPLSFYTIYFQANDVFVYFLCVFADLLNTIVIDVYIIIVKSNRELWRKYLEKRPRQVSLEMR